MKQKRSKRGLVSLLAVLTLLVGLLGNALPVMADSGSWETITVENPYYQYQRYNCAWGTGPDNVYIGENHGFIAHYDGSTAVEIDTAGAYQHFLAIWGTGPNDIFAVGFDENDIRHWNGSGWEVMSPDGREVFWGIWGTTSNNVYVAGNWGIIQHYDGSNWTTMTTPTDEDFYAIWGSNPDDIFAVGSDWEGYGAAIVHYDGSGWSNMQDPQSQFLNGVWGSAGDNVYAVGEAGTILHYDGQSWTSVPSGTTEDLWAISGTSVNDIFIVGGNGTILHYDGTAWSPLNNPATEHLKGLWLDGNGTAFFVGENNTFLKYTYEISPNTPPVADDQYVTVPYNTETDINLTASDADEEPLTYEIVDNPTHGLLGGTAPDVTYTPHDDYTGPDSFTFRAFDGEDYSNTATVSITVNPSSPYGVQVVDYNGTFGNSPYDDPDSLLGKPSTRMQGGSRVKLVEAAYGTYPTSSDKLITTINSGEYITVKFDHQVTDDPNNPYGIDLLVFGNAFFVGTGWVSDATNMDTYMLSNPASCFAEPVTVSVSQDGQNWYEFSSGPYADSMFPTHAYEWDSVNHAWTDNEMDFTRPVNPALTLSSFDGLSAAQAIALYDGSGGGTGYDLADIGLEWIQYVKVTSNGGEVDAFADVAPVVTPSVTVDLRATGLNGEVINIADDYPVPAGTVTEDGHTINTQTALGAVTYYCQQNGINIELAVWQQYIVPYQIGNDAVDEGLWGCFLNHSDLARQALAGQPLTDDSYVHFYNMQIPDATIDLRATGMGGDIFNADDYAVPFGTVAEDGFVIDTQTAMGAVVYYCQQNTTDITVQSGAYGLNVYQIGTNASDENSWTYTVDEATPWVSGDQYALAGGGSVHWANYTLGLYSLHLSIDDTEIEPGDSVTATVTYTNGEGQSVPVESADVFVSSSVDGGGNPMTPGTLAGQTNSSGQLIFTWNDTGTFYPYATWNGKDTVYQWPVASFTCTDGNTPAWDLNGDNQIDIFDMLLVANHLGETGSGGWITEDFNSDGVIDIFDMLLVANHLGE